MYFFEASIHARPAQVEPGQSIVLRGEPTSTLSTPNGLRESFQRTFEQVEAELSRFERMYCEPDGSFVWVSNQEPVWQLDGQLYDCRERLHYVELRGVCPPATLDQFLVALGWPEVDVVLVLLHAGLVLDLEQFRQYAARAVR